MTAQAEMEFEVPARYPHRPGFKKIGTSEEAAESLGDVKESHRRVLAVLDMGNFTADEIAERMNVTVLYCRPRCSELIRLGKIVETNERRANVSGKKAAVLQRK